MILRLKYNISVCFNPVRRVWRLFEVCVLLMTDSSLHGQRFPFAVVTALPFCDNADERRRPQQECSKFPRFNTLLNRTSSSAYMHHLVSDTLKNAKSGKGTYTRPKRSQLGLPVPTWIEHVRRHDAVDDTEDILDIARQAEISVLVDGDSELFGSYGEIQIE